MNRTKHFAPSLVILLTLIASFSINIALSQPLNDNICAAKILEVDVACTDTTNNNIGATLQEGEPIGACFEGGVNSVWFRFVAPSSGAVNISTNVITNAQNQNDDTEMAVYRLTGGDCSDFTALEEIGCNQDNGEAPLPFTAVIRQLSVTPGETYYIQVSGWDDSFTGPAEGVFCIEVSSAQSQVVRPLNDSICDAFTLTVDEFCNGIRNGSTTSATQEPNEPLPSCFIGENNSVWYRFVAPETGFATIRTDADLDDPNANVDTEIALYRQLADNCSDFSALEAIACNQDFGIDDELNGVLESVSVIPGEIYYVQVSGSNGSQGSFCIEVLSAFPPVNDNFCDALSLTVDASCNGLPNGDNSAASTQENEPRPSCFGGIPYSVWFRFQAPATGQVRITTDANVAGTNSDTELAVYRFTADTCANLAGLQELACAQEGGSLLPQNAAIEALDVIPGEEYFIQVSSSAINRGTFCLEVISQEPQVPGDEVCEAIEISLDAAPAIFNTLNASTREAEQLISPPLTDNCNSDEGWCSDTLIQNSLWFRFEAPASGSVSIDLCTDANSSPTNFDTQLAAYEAADCEDYSSFRFLAANEDQAGCQGASQLSLTCLIPGNPYYVLVDGFNGAVGTFELQISSQSLTPMSFSSETFSPSCPGGENGSAQLFVSNGVAPFSYLWSTQDTTDLIQGIAAGMYTITVTDACDSIAVVELAVDEAEAINIDPGQDMSLCLGDAVMLGGSPTVSGGVPFSRENLYVSASETGGLAKFELDTPQAGQVLNSSTRQRWVAMDFSPRALLGLDADQNTLAFIDSIKGVVLSEESVLPETGHRWSGLAFDGSRQRLLALSRNLNGNGGILYEISLRTFQVAQRSTLSSLASPGWLAINRSGEIFVLDAESDQLFKLDPNTFDLALVGSIGFDADGEQDADFDPVSQQLFMGALNTATNQTDLRIINTQSGNSSSVGAIGASTRYSALAISGKVFQSEYEYTWFPNSGLDDFRSPNPMASPPMSFTYTVTVADLCGTETSAPIQLSVSDLEVNTSVAESDSLAQIIVDIAVSEGVPPYEIRWFEVGVPGADTLVQTASQLQITLTQSGVYRLEVTDGLGCTLSDELGLFLSNAPALAQQLQFLSLYPNPSAGSLTLSAGFADAVEMQLEIYDLQGKRLYQEQIGTQATLERQWDFSDWPTGLYLLRIQSGKGSVHKRFLLY